MTPPNASTTPRTAHAEAIIAAARRLVVERGHEFTIQELVKEAGVALQTFYRQFGSKDRLLLAVIEQTICEGCASFEQAARALDPLDRLHFYVTAPLRSLDPITDLRSPRAVTAEHWRLHQLFPDEVSAASGAFTELVARELRAATELGQLAVDRPEHCAWFANKLVTAAFHHYAYATRGEPLDDVAEKLWAFCLAGFGGLPDTTPATNGRATRHAR